MMRSVLFSIASMCISVSAFGQDLPLHFDDNTQNFSVFGGTQFSRVKDPLRPNNTVALFKNSGGGDWEGAYIDLQKGVRLDSSKKLIFSVYHPDKDSFSIHIKLEQSQNGQPDIYIQRNFLTQTWLRDSFDFSKAKVSGTDQNIVGTGTYKRVTLFFEAGASKSGDFYFDELIGFTTSGGSQQNSGVKHYGKLVWADEFDYSGKPKAENWHHQVIPPNNGGWFNGEIQHYTDKIDNSYVSNGSMKIVLKKELYTYDNSTKDYTSARLNSKFAFTYGRIDVRAKIPAGSGVWPAIWTLGTNIGETGNYWGRNAQTVGWPKCGEMDIMESWGHNPNYVSAAVHTQERFGSVETGGTRLDDPYNDYHVYSLVWSPDKLMFFVDSIEIYTYDPQPKTADNWPFTKDQYILLNIAVLPQVAPTFDSSRMEIDYVRVYQEKDNASTAEGLQNAYPIFPNPARRFVQIPAELGAHFYEIYDLGGRKLLGGSLDASGTIDLEGIQTGVYTLSLGKLKQGETATRSESVYHFRLIKE